MLCTVLTPVAAQLPPYNVAQFLPGTCGPPCFAYCSCPCSCPPASIIIPRLSYLEPVPLVIPPVDQQMSTCPHYDVHLFLPGTCSGDLPRCVYCCSSCRCPPAPIMMSTYSYLEPVLEVLHAESVVVPPVAVHLCPLLVVHLVPHIVIIPSLARRSQTDRYHSFSRETILDRSLSFLLS